jgi:hypothetical protein
VNKILWMAAPWRWTLGSLTPFSLASGTQDYSITLPSDFLYIYDAYITDGAKTGRELSVEPFLQSNVGLVGQPSEIAYVGVDGNVTGHGIFRVAPIPATQPTSNAPEVYSRYKKTAPIITASNQGTPGVLIFDDEWFWVYQAGVTWLAYLYSDDQRAGSWQVDANGRAAYTGQLGVFQGAISWMREREKLPLLEPRQNEPKAVSK